MVQPVKITLLNGDVHDWDVDLPDDDASRAVLTAAETVTRILEDESSIQIGYPFGVIIPTTAIATISLGTP